MISEVDIQDMRELNDYQEAAWETTLDSARNSSYLFNGLAGEAGEVCSLFAKAIRDGVPSSEVFADNLKKELGDVLWFVSGLAKTYGFTLQQVAEANIEKLNSRKARGTLKGSGNER
jgi:NTP pyrophosphatase (non-canonical NTP hydrolase)